jgi:hypothetical protein
MIAGYLGSTDHFDQAIGDYAVVYADRVERDYASFGPNHPEADHGIAVCCV